MLGTWSSESVGFESNGCAITHIIFEKDGKAFRGSPRCGAGFTYTGELTELTWERDGDDAVILHFPEGEDPSDAWRLSVGEHPITGRPECNALRLEEIRDGVHYGGQLLYSRGAVCTEDLGPCPEGQGSCESYRTVWCDEQPEKCEDVLPCSCS